MSTVLLDVCRRFGLGAASREVEPGGDEADPAGEAVHLHQLGRLGPEAGGVDVTPRRTVGRTTGVVAGAGTAGPALAAIIVHLWPNLADVEWALATLLGLGVACSPATCCPR